MIRSDDGLTTICTHTAEAAVDHVRRLEQAGVPFTISNMNGHKYDLKELHRVVQSQPKVGPRNGKNIQ